MGPKPPKSSSYYQTLYIRKDVARQKLTEDVLASQRELARRLANAIDTTTSNPTPNPPE